MNPRFHKLFLELETQKAEIFNLVRVLPSEKLSHNPKPNKWSILQILTHLVIAERLSLQYMKKKSLGIDKAGNSGLLEEVKSLALMVSQRLPLRYKAPKFLAESTPAALPLDEIFRQWSELRHDLENFLEKIEEHNVRKKIYRHPIAGRLDTRHALDFIFQHIEHHWPQIERLM